MRITSVIPVVGVKDLGKARQFYTDVVGFDVVFQNDWYLHLRAQGNEQLEIGFVASNHPLQPPLFQPVFDGRGVYYSLQVEDVDAEYRRLREKGVPIALDMRDEPWGERHFAIEDPHGVILNISRTDPAKRGQMSYREHMMQRERGVYK